MVEKQEMPIFTRTFDLLTWLLPATNHFPRAHRHTATKRLLDAAFDLRYDLMARVMVIQPGCANRTWARRLSRRWGVTNEF
jgi:hypothetical protein